MSNIKPLSYPNKGVATRIEVTILSFKTDDKTCGTYWELLTKDGEVLDKGNYYLTQSEYDKWGSDDEYIVQCVVDSLPDTEILK